LATIHDRMPLVLPAEVFGDWLHGSPDAMATAQSVPPAPLVFHHMKAPLFAACATLPTAPA